MKDTSWMEAANCRGIPEPDIFYPTGTAREARLDAQSAISICSDCGVVRQCEAWAKLFSRGEGVWAGRLRGVSRSDGAALTVVEDSPVHGTDAAYKAHTRRGEKACVGCLQAHRLAHTIRRERREA